MQCNLVNSNFTDNYLENLLLSRGIVNIDEYLNPVPSMLQRPVDLKNIQLGAELYCRTVKNNGKILIIVDSDVDGYTSASIIYQYTKLLNPDISVDYWLHSGKQHGLQDHIKRLMTQNVNYDLLILPDSSSNDATYHDMLDEIHLPCLILDHHLTDVKLSDNAVVINNQLSPNYRNKELTGAGIVYQFCRFVDEKLDKQYANFFMDLAAWGIIGDMGAMTEPENRYIAYTGLKTINNDFLHFLLEKQAYPITGSSEASWDEILSKTNPISMAFYIVPMVNALIRVGSMDEKELLFTAFIDGNRMVECKKSGAKGTKERACVEAARICTNAKNHQNSTLEAKMITCESQISKYALLDNKILVIRLEESDIFPSEINGLLAMKLSAKYKKPTMVIRRNNEGFDKGSMRGLNQSALKDFKKFLMDSGYVEWCQGHANAAGVCIRDDNLHDFHDYANRALANVDFGENVYDINFERAIDDSDILRLITEITEVSGIWGQQNPEPMIYISNISVTPANLFIMGAKMSTVKIVQNGISFMKFNAKSLIKQLEDMNNNATLTIIGKANMHEWQGRHIPQIFIEDFELKEKSILDF